jgi:hypothetical protein
MDKFENNQAKENMKNNTSNFEKPREQGLLKIIGHVKIYDPKTNEIFVDKDNSIHYENFSVALANSIANLGKDFISKMAFGNGGSRVDPTGIITYLTPNTSGLNASLYNQTYEKVVDGNNPYDIDPSRNFMEVRHITGTPYSDVLVSCLLDFGEPSDQAAFDASINQDGTYVFDELGLRGYTLDGSIGPLLTHVIFHPVQKALNRLIQIDYTVRVQSLTIGI